jgi:quinol monooxygenase YgiN
MHAVVFQVDMKEGRDDDTRPELEQLIGSVKAVPGFVRGTWTTDGSKGVSMVIMESEEAALEMAANASIPPEASVVFRSADVLEVVGEA